jgi:hypothetical protein
VTRASASLPSVILWALGPKDPGEGALVTVALLSAGLLTTTGLWGVVRLRSWGLVTLTAAALVWLVPALVGHPSLAHSGCAWALSPHFLGDALLRVHPGTIALLLVAAVLPFAGPAVRYLARPARN